ncbi:MAG TPA: hypothetical protein V6C58_05755 [Allocoleopsis sp.]
MSQEEKQVKKRGRKPKTVVKNTDQDNPPTVKRKRGRKPKIADFKKVDDAILEPSFDFEEIFILHLPIQHSRILEIYNSTFKKEIIKVDNNHVPTTIETKQGCDPESCRIISGNLENVKIHDISLLPKSLETGKIIPCNVNIACWWCCHYFDTYPVCIPTKYIQKKHLFSVKGCFCSFNCAKAYIIKENKVKDCSLLYFMYKKIKGENYTYIKPSPKKEILKKFGGHVSIEEYRDSFNTLKSYEFMEFPMIPEIYQIVEKNRYESHMLNNNKCIEKITKKGFLD